MSSKSPQIIILLGRSGCGKGTQAELLEKEFGFDHISGGELFRREAKKDNFTGHKLKKYLEEGILVPLFFALRVWSEEAERLMDKKDFKGLILDGNPRRLQEAELLDSIFDWYEWEDVKVILVDISEKEAYNRLTKRRICRKCGRIIPWVGEFKKLEKCDECGGELEIRSDDTKEAIKKRLSFYESDVAQVVGHYEKKGQLVKIDGEQSIEDVYQDIIVVLEK